MDLDDLSQPLESVMHQESKPRPLPLRAKDHRELFAEWCRLNPEALAEMERTAMELSARGRRISTKYLIEKQRYEGHARLTPVTFYDLSGNPHTYGVCNTITPLLARWLLGRHPDIDITIKHSIFDDKENDDD